MDVQFCGLMVQLLWTVAVDLCAVACSFTFGPVLFIDVELLMCLSYCDGASRIVFKLKMN